MTRPKKSGAYVNFVLAQDLYDRLNAYIEKEQRTKTATFEMALREFLDRYEKEQAEKNSK